MRAINSVEYHIKHIPSLDHERHRYLVSCVKNGITADTRIFENAQVLTLTAERFSDITTNPIYVSYRISPNESGWSLSALIGGRPGGSSEITEEELARFLKLVGDPMEFCAPGVPSTELFSHAV